MGRVLFVNLTRLCNVDCPRCYLTPENRRSKLALRQGLLTDILSSDFFSKPASDGEHPLVIFQGGEPTIVGHTAFLGYIDEVRRVAPAARMTMVSNLMRLPDWVIDVSREYFDCRIETTWAAGNKKSLRGDEAVFQERFAHSLTKATTAGITCPVNVELNRETFDAGPGAIIDLARRTGARTFEFDFSVQFDDFRTKPAFRKGNYPMLPGSLSYLEFRTFVVGLRREIISQGLQGSITSNLLRDMSERKMDMAFNVCREADFVTVNPDSTVTTNPLFSDIPETYIGSLEEQGLDRILAHPNRRDRIAYEQDRRSVCKGCEFVEICEGGPSHVPVEDGSGECAGLKGLLHRLSVGCAAR